MATFELLASEKERELSDLRQRAELATRESMKGECCYLMSRVRFGQYEYSSAYLLYTITCYLSACVALENDLSHERASMARLQADFNYNLSLLSQRDEELSGYEEAFSQVKRVVTSLMAENSQLKVSLETVVVVIVFQW